MAKLSDLIPTYKQRIEKLMRDPISATASKVSIRSPVDTGYFRQHWIPMVNGVGVGSISGAVAKMQIGDSFSYINHTPYGPRLEYEAWSNQAPKGMVRISAAEWPAEVRRSANGG